MQLTQLIIEARRRLDDSRLPYQHSDVVLRRLATEGEREAADRARLIFDDTSDFLTYAVTSATPSLTLDPLVLLDVEIAATMQFTAGGRPRELQRIGVDMLSDRNPEWRTETGRPTHFCIIGNALRLYPAPSTDYPGTLALAVYRFPLDPLTGGAEPEIPERFHADLVDWMVYRASQPKDGEIYNPAQAQEALDAFERRFGKKRNAEAARRQGEQRRITTRYAG